MTFKAGDVVRLKTGGPALTVTEAAIHRDAWVFTVHHDGSHFVWVDFPSDALEKLDPSQVPKSKTVDRDTAVVMTGGLGH